MIIEQLLVVGFCVGSLNHTEPVQWKEKWAVTEALDALLYLPHCLEGQKDAKEGDCGQGSGTKSRTSRECCELVQHLDHFSKTSCLTEHSLTSLRFPLPSDLLEQSGWRGCLPAHSNELMLLTQFCLSSLRHYCLQWFSGGHRTALKYIKHNFLSGDMGEQCKLLAVLFIFQSHSILHSYKILGGAVFEFYNHRLI